MIMRVNWIWIKRPQNMFHFIPTFQMKLTVFKKNTFHFHLHPLRKWHIVSNYFIIIWKWHTVPYKVLLYFIHLHTMCIYVPSGSNMNLYEMWYSTYMCLYENVSDWFSRYVGICSYMSEQVGMCMYNYVRCM